MPREPWVESPRVVAVLVQLIGESLEGMTDIGVDWEEANGVIESDHDPSVRPAFGRRKPDM